MSITVRQLGEVFDVEKMGRKGSTNPIKSEKDKQILNFANEDSGKTNAEIEESLLADYQEAAEAISGQKTKAEAESEAKATEKAQETAPAQQTQGTDAVANSKEMEELDEKIKDLKEQKDKKCKQMDKIEEKIKEKAEAAKENIMKAAQLQEEQVKEHKEECDQVLNENIQAYIAANKEGGEGMTRDELQQNIKSALPNAPAAADAVAALTAASKDINEMDQYLGELGKVIADVKQIDGELKGLEGAKEAAEKAAEEAAKQRQCCDPMGFTVGEGDEKAQYDFIIDDGAFDSTSDFLGAKDQWAAMQALDTDKDGSVSTEEMAAGNIKAVKRGADGKQSVVDLASEFGKDFKVDLNSYKEGGSHSAVDTSSGKQEMLGTFNVNINGEDVNAYNTLDDVDFLQETYQVADGTDVAEEVEEAEDTEEYSMELQPHVNFFNEYTELSEELKKQVAEGFANFGVTEENINEINNTTKKEADEDAKIFMASLAAEDTDEAKKAEESEDTEEVDETASEGENAEEVADEQVAEAPEAEAEQEQNENADENDNVLIADNENPFEAEKDIEFDELIKAMAA